MAFFSFEKKLQILLIAGALVGAPACYDSKSGTDDVGGEDTTHVDVRDADVTADDLAVDDLAVDDGLPPDVPDGIEDAEEEEWIVVDPLPSPQCDEVPAMTVTVTQEDASPSHVVASVQLTGGLYTECSPLDVCLEAAVEGPGTISGITQVDYENATFRYENDSLPQYENVTIRLTWHVNCWNYGDPDTDTVTGFVYVCRDMDAVGNLKVSGRFEDCPIFEAVPGPMYRRNLQPGVKIAGTPERDGRLLLSLRGQVGRVEEVRWEASAGVLEILSPGRALFSPEPGSSLQVVQASIVTPREVIVEVFRLKKG
jgi:hypothetical protein